ncbi:hypothetical protein FS837_002426 [Tulasnella sp. UAMH 9824]|nr:hypothetical protein FS837_002426 [Tulasnella sp. UAMH 9824]
MTWSNTEPRNEPPAKPSTVSHGSTKTNPTNIDDPTLRLFDKAQSVKDEAKNILETATWPGKSAAVAREFSNTIKNTPNLRNIPRRAALSSPDLQNDVQQIIKVLEDVRERLACASSDYGAGKKGFFGSIKNSISWGATRSSEILRSCREDLERAWTPLHRRLEDDLRAVNQKRRSAEYNDVGPSSQIAQDTRTPSSEVTPGVKPQHNPTGAEGKTTKQPATTQDPIANPTRRNMSTSNASNQDDVEPSSQISPNIHPLLSEATPGVKPQDNPTGTERPPAKQTDMKQNSTAYPPLREWSMSSPSDQKQNRSVSAQMLNATGKVFTAVDTVSELIPIVGSYVGAAAKVS